MDFNTQNQLPTQGAPGGNSWNKTNAMALAIVAIAVLVLIFMTYWYMQGWKNDYFPGYMMDDYKVMDKVMIDEKTEATDAGPGIVLDKDSTSDIQSDIDQTTVKDVDGQFMDIDKDLQSL